MGNLGRDVRFGLRTLARDRAFSLVAVAVLALGIGGNGAIFSLVNALVLRPLVLAEPERLVGLYDRGTVRPDDYRAFSYPNYVDLREGSATFTAVAAHNLSMVGLAEGETTRRAFADVVTSNWFELMGVELARGRAFLPAEERPGAGEQVVIVSYAHWQRTGEDPGIVGRTLRINGRPFTVVGVAPRGFSGTTALFSPELWLPMGVFETAVNDFVGDRKPLADRGNHCLIAIGRLAPGVSPAAADAELATRAAALGEAFPKENRERTVHVAPLSRLSVSTSPQRDDALSTLSVLLMAMAGIVLLIACLNLANMLLARGTARRKEFAIRIAVGAGRGPIVRQLLVEGLLLSAAGGVAGSLLAYFGNRLLVRSLTGLVPIPLIVPLAPDLRSLAALGGFCLLSTLLFGLGPALQLARPGVVAGLKDGGAAERAGGRLRGLLAPRNLLVVGQLALSMILLTAAGLFVRGALAGSRPELGIPVDDVVLVEVDASLVGYDEARGRPLYRRLVERAAALPGVEAVSLAATVPFGMVSLGDEVAPSEGPRFGGGDPAAGAPSVSMGLSLGDGDSTAEEIAVSVGMNIVGADYFATFDRQLVQGRPFTPAEEESAGAPPAVIVDRTLAERLWPGESAVGRRLQLAQTPGVDYEVIGVAPPLRAHLFEIGDHGQIYLPFGRRYMSNMHLQLRAPGLDAARRERLFAALRGEIRELDAALPVLGMRTLAAQLDGSIELWALRAGATLFVVFGSLALFLAAVGAYGVRAYTVGQRTREIGVRMALGGTPRDVHRLVMREGLGLTLAGLGVGLGLAFAVARLLSSFLYEVGAADPIVFSIAPVFLLAAISLACYLPARRAARVDPMVALRDE
jgi:putative ABC transport system permease protein